MSDVFSTLQKTFSEGSTPKKLDGFYRGSLNTLLPKTFAEHLGSSVSPFYLPWRGKHFDEKRQRGINVFSSSLSPLLRIFAASAFTGKTAIGALAFPFTTMQAKGVQDTSLTVLRLSYDLPENPPPVRKVVDELIATGKDQYLGKAFLTEANEPRLVAFFTLTR